MQLYDGSATMNNGYQYLRLNEGGLTTQPPEPEDTKTLPDINMKNMKMDFISLMQTMSNEEWKRTSYKGEIHSNLIHHRNKGPTLAGHTYQEADFRKMLDEVSRNFGFKDATKFVGKSVVSPRKDDDPSKDRHRKETSVTDLMKDTHLVERYSKYLNKCMFITNDQFLKKKH